MTEKAGAGLDIKKGSGAICDEINTRVDARVDAEMNQTSVEQDTASHPQNSANTNPETLSEIISQVENKLDKLDRLTGMQWSKNINELEGEPKKWEVILFCLNFFTIVGSKKKSSYDIVKVVNTLTEVYEQLNTCLKAEIDDAKSTNDLLKYAQRKRTDPIWKIGFSNTDQGIEAHIKAYAKKKWKGSSDATIRGQPAYLKSDALENLKRVFKHKIHESERKKR